MNTKFSIGDKVYFMARLNEDREEVEHSGTVIKINITAGQEIYEEYTVKSNANSSEMQFHVYNISIEKGYFPRKIALIKLKIALEKVEEIAHRLQSMDSGYGECPPQEVIALVANERVTDLSDTVRQIINRYKKV